jgi:hypothetical protein
MGKLETGIIQTKEKLKNVKSKLFDNAGYIPKLFSIALFAPLISVFLLCGSSLNLRTNFCEPFFKVRFDIFKRNASKFAGT